MKSVTLTARPKINPTRAEVAGDNAVEFRVEKIIDSTVHLPGDMISKRTVDDYCRSAQWKVNIVPVKELV